MAPAPQLDGSSVVFGRVIDGGDQILEKIEGIPVYTYKAADASGSVAGEIFAAQKQFYGNYPHNVTIEAACKPAPHPTNPTSPATEPATSRGTRPPLLALSHRAPVNAAKSIGDTRASDLRNKLLRKVEIRQLTVLPTQES